MLLKTMFRTMMIVAFTLIFTGCSDKKTEEPPSIVNDSRLTLEQAIEEIQDNQVTEIDIFKSESHGSIGSTLLKKLSGSEEISVVVQSLSTASQRLGIADTSIPDYDFVIVLDDHKSISFHYWIDAENKRGMLANINDTSIIYTVSKNSIQDLLHLIN